MVVLVGLLIPAVAPGVTFQDSTLGVKFALNASDGRTCVIRPSALRNPVACEGIKVEAIEAGLPADMRFAAFVIKPDGKTMVVLEVTQNIGNKGPWTKAQTREFVGGALDRLRERKVRAELLKTKDGADPIEYRFENKVQVFRYGIESQPAPIQPFEEMLFYQAVSKENLFTLAFMGDRAHLAANMALGEATIKTLHAPITIDAPSWQEGGATSVAFRHGAQSVDAALFLLGGLVLIFFFSKSRAAKRPVA